MPPPPLLPFPPQGSVLGNFKGKGGEQGRVVLSSDGFQQNQSEALSFMAYFLSYYNIFQVPCRPLLLTLGSLSAKDQF